MTEIKKILKKRLTIESTLYWILSGLYSNPIRFQCALLRSLFATRKLTGNFYPIKVRLGICQKLNIKKSKSSIILIKGNLIVTNWGGSNQTSSINCSDNAKLTILGDFELGPNIHIDVCNDATLTIKGRKNSTASGITCNSRIMVEKCIEIGFDCIIAWDVLITDSDWHNIKGIERTLPIYIGDNVWITHGVSITKGANIPSGCIIGAKSLITRSGVFKKNSLIAGIPALERKTNIEWSR